MEVSCKSPGSNSWAPFKPSSSQPRRKTDRLSYKRQQRTTDLQSSALMNRVAHRTDCHTRKVGSYQPSNGGGQSVYLLDQPWFDCTQQPEWRRGRKRDELSLRAVFMNVIATSDIKNWVGVMSQAYSHNRMPFSNPLRKSLSPKVFPVTAWGRRTGRDKSKGGGLELQLQLTTHIYATAIFILSTV